jgi:hypothetical protein
VLKLSFCCFFPLRCRKGIGSRKGRVERVIEKMIAVVVVASIYR